MRLLNPIGPGSETAGVDGYELESRTGSFGWVQPAWDALPD